MPIEEKTAKRRRVTRVVTFRAKDAHEPETPWSHSANDAPGRPTELRLVERREERRKKIEEIEGRLRKPRRDDDIRLYHCPMQNCKRLADIPTWPQSILSSLIFLMGETFCRSFPNLSGSGRKSSQRRRNPLLLLRRGVFWISQSGFSPRSWSTVRWIFIVSGAMGQSLQHLRCVTQATPVVIFLGREVADQIEMVQPLSLRSPGADLHPWQKVLDETWPLVESSPNQTKSRVRSPGRHLSPLPPPARSWPGDLSAATKKRGTS